MKNNKAYFAEVLEIEDSWDRPDGYLISLSKEKLNNFINSEECFKRVGNIYCVVSRQSECLLKEEGLDAIEKSEKGVFWVPTKKDGKKYIDCLINTSFWLIL